MDFRLRHRESGRQESIYEIPVRFFEQGLDREVCQRLRLETKEPDLQPWRIMTERILHPTQRVRIAVVGKYTDLHDAYKSVQEALIHGGIPSEAKVEIEWLASDQFTDQAAAKRLLGGCDGLLIPGGFGERGIGGMVEAVRWARENDLPFFGICLGLQVAIIEFARNVCRLPDTNSTEFEPNCETPVISLMHSQRDVSDLGGPCGSGPTPPGSGPAPGLPQAYGTGEISERHRHRWEVSNAYRDVLAEFGLRLSGQSPDGGLVEVIELPDHAWFIGCQFHPELKSRPTRPHPLFAGFIAAAMRRRAAAPARGGRGAGRELALMAWSFGRTPFLIAGPCVIEPGDVLPRVAEVLARIERDLGIPVCLKASFDKANRSRLTANRGPGLDDGLRALERARASSGLPILTDIHEVQQAAAVAQVADVLQIPAFLCRQTDLLVAAGRTGKPVNVKKGQWMQAEGMRGAVEKVRSAGAPEVAVTERGTFFGYGDLVVDMRNFVRLRQATGAAGDLRRHPRRAAAGAGRVRIQRRPAGVHSAAARAAGRAGADGFFLETHPDPARALSDAATQWPLDQLADLVGQTLDVWGRARV